ncbi:hypothetical protein EDB87DRAFT_1541776, partial [Lactarius vividus]
YTLPGADATFVIDNEAFHVHSYFFTRESPFFRRLWNVPGDTTTNPINVEDTGPEEPRGSYYCELHDVTAQEFRNFLWVFYNPQYSVYRAPVRQWAQILRLAQKWEFRDVGALCWRHLLGLETSPPLPLDQHQALESRDKPLTSP